MFKILLAEDDDNYRKLLARHLEKEGYEVVQSSDGKQAYDNFLNQYFDLLVTDVMMPNIDGNQLVIMIKKQKPDFPIIMLTALDSFSNKQKGFILGADDYIVKPADFNELLLRISALLRRCKIVNEKKITHKNVELDFATNSLSIAGKRVELTKKEFLLLFKLMSSPNIIFTRTQLLDEIWGLETYSIERTVDVHINKVREQLKTDDVEILSVRGIGYKAVLK